MKREPRYFYEPSGHCVAAMPLANGAGEAEMYSDDLERLRRAGLGLSFSLNHNGRRAHYVRADKEGAKVMVARFIAGARKGEIVHHRDGNRLNLRRENLELGRGKARMDCRFCEESREAL